MNQVDMSKQKMGFQKTIFDSLISSMSFYWDSTQSLSEFFVKNSPVIPEQGKQAFLAWVKSNRAVLEIFKRNMEGGFNVMSMWPIGFREQEQQQHERELEQQQHERTRQELQQAQNRLDQQRQELHKHNQQREELQQEQRCLNRQRSQWQQEQQLQDQQRQELQQEKERLVQQRQELQQEQQEHERVRKWLQ